MNPDRKRAPTAKDGAIDARRRQSQRRARARTKTVLQLEAAECGPASLAMVLSFFGRRVPLEELRVACGVSRDGSKASSILRAARSYGLEARGLKVGLSQLHRLARPMIAFVNFHHFLVVEGVRRNKVYVNDPASGPAIYTLDEFGQIYSGVVLTFRAGPDFSAGDSRPRRTAALRERLRGHELIVGFVTLVSLTLVFPGLVIPAGSRIFVDYVLVPKMDDWLLPLLIGMLATTLVTVLLAELQTQHLLKAETRLSIDGSSATLKRLLRLPVQFFSQRYAGEIAERLDLNDSLATLLTGEVARATMGVLTAMFFFAVMLTYSVALSLVALGIVVLLFVVLGVVMRSLQDQWRKITLDEGKLHSTSVAGIQDIETFKAAGAEDALFRRVAGLQASLVNADQVLGRSSIALKVTPVFAQTLAAALILVVGGFEIMRGELTIGMLVAFQALMTSFAGPVMSLMYFGAHLQQIRAFLARLDDIQQHPLDQRFAPDAPGQVGGATALPRGAVTLAAVSFGYAPFEPPVVEGIDISLRPGWRVALVGGSGSGKSTLGRLIAGLYRPRSGEVLLDGRPLADWPQGALSGSLAYVDQHITLFEGTVRENLSLWDSNIPEEDVIQAARDAHIHDTIASRPGGYDALIEEAGRNFSGGQRQRLDIARALAHNPSVLVLDEATSALDPETELKVMNAIRRRGLTCVVIAHRLSAIRDCDEIVMLDGGRVLERGTHAALLELGGRYHELVAA